MAVFVKVRPPAYSGMVKSAAEHGSKVIGWVWLRVRAILMVKGVRWERSRTGEEVDVRTAIEGCSCGC